MLVFYFADHCPYCVKVREYCEQTGISYITRPVVVRTPDNEYGKELIARAGKAQVPYMIDDSTGVEMYESEDILAHLREHHIGKQQEA